MMSCLGARQMLNAEWWKPVNSMLEKKLVSRETKRWNKMNIFDTKRKMEKMANLSPVCHHREADEEEHNDVKLAPPESKPTDC